MTKRIILLGMVCGLLATGTGCGLLRSVLGVGAPYNSQYGAVVPGPTCGAACGPGCESRCGAPSPGVCQPACSPAPAPACNQPCGPVAAPCGPLTWICRLFRGGCGFGGGCGSCGGCGEMYYGDCCGNPSDRCDPCDNWGNYIGGSAGGSGGVYVAGTAPQQVGVGAATEVAQRPAATRK